MVRYNGIIPVYKDPGITSHDVIYRMRRIIRQQKIGHTGTLDPMASGLLLICLGRATKLTQFLIDWDKKYRAEIRLGMVSNTYDSDGEIIEGGPVPKLEKAGLLSILNQFEGEFRQKVPAYSAVKVKGKELYKYARKGTAVDIPEKDVRIDEIKLLSFTGDTISIVVECSKGTYIRSLAHDIGEKLGCGAYLSRLERLAIGPFEVASALTLMEVELLHDKDELAPRVMPIENILDFPKINFSDSATGIIKNGAMPETSDLIGWHGEFSPGDFLAMTNEAGEVIAIGKSKYGIKELKDNPVRDFFTYVRVLI